MGSTIRPTLKDMEIVNLKAQVDILGRALDLAVFALWAHVDEPEELMKITFLEEAITSLQQEP